LCCRENGVLSLLVLPAASSLRSAMSRNALLCMQDLILGLQEQTATHFDAIVPVLLSRACSEKQFLRDLAREVLDTALQARADEQFLRPHDGEECADCQRCTWSEDAFCWRFGG